jgi:1,2-dihydroxy-3-keto-5-methylthiopentene dioxygenase
MISQLHIPKTSRANNRQGDQREPHDSGRSIDADYLSNLGVLYYQFADVQDVDKLAAERSYKNRDLITVSPEKMGEVYEEKVRMFFNEHLHEDEEIRYIRDGAGFFDVRSEGDEWVRIFLEKDDLIVDPSTSRENGLLTEGQILPAGIYHRFTTDSNNVSRGLCPEFQIADISSSLWLCVCSKRSQSGRL